ncbi:MAG: SseB family protein [Erysipelothrix sp.]
MKNIFKMFNKNTNNDNADKEESHVGDAEADNFVYGVEDTFKLRDSNDLIVVGHVRGTVKQGMAVYVSNIGDDDGGVVLTEVISMEKLGKMVTAATDTPVGIRLSNCSSSGVKIGSVIHTRETSTKDVHTAYTFALNETYIKLKNLELTDEEISKMSITDCAESWNLFNKNQHSMLQGASDIEVQVYRSKIDFLANHLINKILDAQEIYTVFNKRTGEPHLFSNTIKQNDGNYLCTPPDILIVSKAYSKIYEQYYPKELFEIKVIKNGDQKDGIYNFFGSSFYLNGACGVAVNSPKTAINAEMIVPKPDYGDTPEIQIPISNPDLVRWMILMGQVGKPQSQDEQLIYNLYYRFMSFALMEAKLLVPMKKDGNKIPSMTADNVLKEDIKISIPMTKGKDKKDSVPLFTDWKRLRMSYDEEWDAMIQPISGLINTFDCSINPTEYSAAGCYITEETFAQMKKMFEGK